MSAFLQSLPYYKWTCLEVNLRENLPPSKSSQSEDTEEYLLLLEFPVSQTSPSIELQTRVNELTEKATGIETHTDQDFFNEDNAPHGNSLKWQVW